jgi:PAS domain S-box-containing protein
VGPAFTGWAGPFIHLEICVKLSDFNNWQGYVSSAASAYGLLLALIPKVRVATGLFFHAIGRFFVTPKHVDEKLDIMMASIAEGRGEVQEVRKQIQQVKNSLAEHTYIMRLSFNGQMIFKCDGHGKALMMSKGWTQFTGQSEEEALGFGWTKMLANEDRERVLQIWLHCVQEVRPYQVEYGLYSVKAGKHVQIEASAGPVLSETGEVLSYCGTVRQLGLVGH